MHGEKLSIGAVAFEVELFPCAVVRLQRFPFCEGCAIWVVAPRVRIYHQIAICSVKSVRLITIVCCECHGDIETLVIVELLGVFKVQVAVCG